MKFGYWTDWLMVTCGVLGVGLVIYGGYISEREVKYKFSYEEKVHEQIQKEVKSECLK